MVVTTILLRTNYKKGRGQEERRIPGGAKRLWPCLCIFVDERSLVGRVDGVSDLGVIGNPAQTPTEKLRTPSFLIPLPTMGKAREESGYGNQSKD